MATESSAEPPVPAGKFSTGTRLCDVFGTKPLELFAAPAGRREKRSRPVVDGCVTGPVAGQGRPATAEYAPGRPSYSMLSARDGQSLARKRSQVAELPANCLLERAQAAATAALSKQNSSPL